MRERESEVEGIVGGGVDGKECDSLLLTLVYLFSKEKGRGKKKKRSRSVLRKLMNGTCTYCNAMCERRGTRERNPFVDLWLSLPSATSYCCCSLFTLSLSPLFSSLVYAFRCCFRIASSFHLNDDYWDMDALYSPAPFSRAQPRACTPLSLSHMLLPHSAPSLMWQIKRGKEANVHSLLKR